MGRVFANDPGDLGSIPGFVVPKTLKMVLDTPLLNTQQYKVCMKGKVFNLFPFPLIFIIYRLIGLVGRVFANGPGDQGSVPGRVIPKTFKMVLDTSLFNTQHYKVHIKGKVEQSRKRSSSLPYTLV